MEYTDDQLVEIQETLMELILTKKMEEGKIVFSAVENGLLH